MMMMMMLLLLLMMMNDEAVEEDANAHGAADANRPPQILTIRHRRACIISSSAQGHALFREDEGEMRFVQAHSDEERRGITGGARKTDILQGVHRMRSDQCVGERSLV